MLQYEPAGLACACRQLLGSCQLCVGVEEQQATPTGAMCNPMSGRLCAAQVHKKHPPCTSTQHMGTDDFLQHLQVCASCGSRLVDTQHCDVLSLSNLCPSSAVDGKPGCGRR